MVVLLYCQKNLNQNIVSELLDQSLETLDICSRPKDLSILQVYLTQLWKANLKIQNKIKNKNKELYEDIELSFLVFKVINILIGKQPFY